MAHVIGIACFASVPAIYGVFAAWCIRLRRACTCPACQK